MRTNARIIRHFYCLVSFCLPELCLLGTCVFLPAWGFALCLFDCLVSFMRDTAVSHLRNQGLARPTPF